MLQHEVKSLSHRLVKLIVDKLLTVNTTDLIQPPDSQETSKSKLL